MTRRHLPMVCGDAFDNPRAEIRIADGIAFVADTQRRFDVVIVDSTDPVGPAQALSHECRSIASCQESAQVPARALVTQNGVPSSKQYNLAGLWRVSADISSYASFYLAAVTHLYRPRPIALAFTCDNPARLAYAAAAAVGQRYACVQDISSGALLIAARRTMWLRLALLAARNTTPISSIDI